MFERGHSVLNFGAMCVGMKKQNYCDLVKLMLDRENDDDYHDGDVDVDGDGDGNRDNDDDDDDDD